MRQNVNKILVLCTLLLLLFIEGCANTRPVLSPMQKRNITTKLIEGSYDNIYRAVLTVLQDQGYIIKTTDMNSGLIVANADRESTKGSQIAQEIFLGYVANKGSKIEVSTMVNKLNKHTSEIRMNIREIKYGQSSIFSGSNEQSVKDIYNPKIYQQFFYEITVEVKRREALNQ